MTNDEVSHKWAHMAQTFGRSGNGNFYFRGPALYSYGSHYLVGYRIPDLANGRHGGVALLNSSKASVTTSSHQSDARSATRGMAQHSIPDLTALRDYLPHLDLDHAQAAIARHVEKHILALTSEAAQYLLGLAGKPNSAADIVRLIGAANEAAAKVEAERKSREYAQNERDMNAAGTQSFDLFTAGLERGLADIRKRGDSHSINLTLKNLRRLHKFASSNGYALKGTLWSRVKFLAREVESAKALHAAATRNEYTRQRAKDFRRYAERFAAHGARNDIDPVSTHVESLEMYDFQQWATACDWLLQHAPGMRRARPAMVATWEKVTAEHARMVADSNRQYEARRAREAAERFDRETAMRELWLSGGQPAGYWRGSDSNGRALLRVMGDELQTSQGARVPLSHAIKAFPLIKLCRETNRTWKRNGHNVRVGVYQIDEIDSSGNFVAGCHSIGWNEVERIALALGVFNQIACDTSEHS